MSLTMTRSTANRGKSCRVCLIFPEKQPHIFVKCFLVFLQRQDIIRSFSVIFFAISVWVPMASIVTIHPFISNISSSLGIAVISLLFSSRASYPSTKPHSVENALTTCSGDFLPSFVRRACFPSIATTPVTFSTMLRIHFTNTVCTCCVSTALITFRKVQASGTPFSSLTYFFSHFSLSFQIFPSLDKMWLRK